MRPIRRNDLEPRPWKNRGGLTWELAAFPEGAGFSDMLWRISLAEVGSDGPFSAFPGIDRTLTVLAGRGMILDFGAGEVKLGEDSAPLSFPGEAPVTARLSAGAILDINVMTRRGRAVHAVHALSAGEPAPRDTRVLVARQNPVTVDGFALAPGEALMSDPGRDLGGAVGDAPMLAVSLRLVP
ncbi:HutD family protein [Rhodovulum sulfidophilum]|nr:HutD family protein [Rhodovulum sulfidophilum]